MGDLDIRNSRSFNHEELHALYEQLESKPDFFSETNIASRIAAQFLALKLQLDNQNNQRRGSAKIKASKWQTNEHTLRALQIGTYLSWAITIGTGAYTTALCYYYDNCQRMFGFAFSGVMALAAQAASNVFSDKQKKIRNRLSLLKNARINFIHSFNQLYELKEPSEELNKILNKCVDYLAEWYCWNDKKRPSSQEMIFDLTDLLPNDHPLKSGMEDHWNNIPARYAGLLSRDILILGRNLTVGGLKNNLNLTPFFVNTWELKHVPEVAPRV